MYAAKAAAASLTPGGSPGNTYHTAYYPYMAGKVLCAVRMRLII